MKNKNKVYSSIEDKLISVLDIEKIIVENDESGDIGFFKVIALVSDNEEGWKEFPGKIDEYPWSEEGLRNLAASKNQEAKRCGYPVNWSVVEIDYVHVKSDKKNEAEMWDELWIKTNRIVNKFARAIKNAQDIAIENRLKTAITLRNAYTMV